MVERTLTDQEIVVILEEIARDPSNKAAQIAAIKTLREVTRSDEGDQSGGVMDAPARRTSHLRIA